MPRFTDISYCNKTGNLTKNGVVLCSFDKSSGYKRVRYQGKWLLSHRVIWEMFNGSFNHNIDHKNGDKLDNRIENLRPCNQSQNTINSSIRSDNTSGYKGVTWSKAANKWASQTMKDGKRVHVGVFENPKEAALAYNYKVLELFGEYGKFNEVFK